MSLETKALVMIGDLTSLSKNVHVYFKVLVISEERTVRTKSSGRQHRVAEAVVGDSSGIITLIIWDSWIEVLQVGRSYSLEGGYVSVYDGSIRLNIGRNGEVYKLEKSIEPVNESINMSKPSLEKKKPRRRSRTGRSLWGKSGREGRGYAARKEF
jgi:replication factor A1